MYYKVMYNDRVIDVLDHLVYVKYQPKHNILTLCSENEAQGFLSSNGDEVWHSEELYKFPVEGYDTVQLIQIDTYEYRKLKMLNGKTAEEIIDAYTLELLKGGVL